MGQRGADRPRWIHATDRDSREELDGLGSGGGRLGKTIHNEGGFVVDDEDLGLGLTSDDLELGVWAGLQSIPTNSTNMPLTTGAVAGSHTCADSMLGSGSWMKTASGDCSGSIFAVGSGSESVVVYVFSRAWLMAGWSSTHSICSAKLP